MARLVPSRDGSQACRALKALNWGLHRALAAIDPQALRGFALSSVRRGWRCPMAARLHRFMRCDNGKLVPVAKQRQRGGASD